MGFGASLAGAGVAMDSFGDYQAKQEARQQGRDRHAQSMRAATMSNDNTRFAMDDAARQRAWADEDRKTIQTHMAALNPPATVAPPPPGPLQRPTPSTAGTQVADATGGETITDAPPSAAQTAPMLPEQPMPVTALPGSTLSASAPEAPAPAAPIEAPTPVAAPNAPPMRVAAAPIVPPTLQRPPPKAPPAPEPAGGRAGLLDVLARKAAERGDLAGSEKFRAQKSLMEKEGFGDAARAALINPADVNNITRAFNESGALRITPGSMVAKSVPGPDGKPRYTGAYDFEAVAPDGTRQKFTDYSMMTPAVALGIIAPAKVVHFGADQNAYSVDPVTGKHTLIQEAQKFEAKISRNGDVVVYDKTGKVPVKIIRPDGQETKLSTEQAKAITEIDTLTHHTLTERNKANETAAINPGVPTSPPLDAPQVASVAQSIFINNPDRTRSGGLNGPLAVKIATAINDKSPDAVTGVANLNGKRWNVVRYGKGDNAAIYGISLVGGDGEGGAPPASAPAAPIPAAGPVRAPSAPMAPALPRPPAMPQLVTAPPVGGEAPVTMRAGKPALTRIDRVKAAEAAQIEGKAKQAADTFRSFLQIGRYSQEDAPVLQAAIDSGKLTPTEAKIAIDMLKKLSP